MTLPHNSYIDPETGEDCQNLDYTQEGNNTMTCKTQQEYKIAVENHLYELNCKVEFSQKEIELMELGFHYEVGTRDCAYQIMHDRIDLEGYGTAYN